jgi:hypothetical protein
MTTHHIHTLASPLLDALRSLITDNLTSKGDKEADCQRLTLLNRLSALEHAFNGIEDSDLVPSESSPQTSPPAPTATDALMRYFSEMEITDEGQRDMEAFEDMAHEALHAQGYIFGEHYGPDPSFEDTEESECTACNDGSCPWCQEEKRLSKATITPTLPLP